MPWLRDTFLNLVITDDEYRIAKLRLLRETLRLIRLKMLIPVPLKLSILRDAWKIIEKYHIYQADAIQVVSAKVVNADEVVTADKRLYQVLVSEGLRAKYVG